MIAKRRVVGNVVLRGGSVGGTVGSSIGKRSE